MPEKYILASHIEKLGHPIEEIRQRALFTILSKLENNVSFDNDLARTKELIVKLFNWFLHEPSSNEKLVFSILRKLILSDTGQIVINHYGRQFILNELNKVESYIDPQYFKYLTEIRDSISVRNNIIVPPLESNVPLSYRSDETCKYTPCVGSTASVIEGFVHKEISQVQNEGTNNVNYNSGSDTISNADSLTYRIEQNENLNECLPNYILKFQPLIESDRHVLKSIENSLNNLDVSTIVHSCDFFINVLLHDFPAEIFLQRPKILDRLQNTLIANGSIKVINIILDCFCHFIKELQMRINHNNDPTLIHSKIDALLRNYCDSYDKRNFENNQTFENEETTELVIKYQIPIPIFCTRLFVLVLKILNGKENLAVKLNKSIYLKSLKLLNELHKLLNLCMTDKIFTCQQTSKVSEVSKMFNEVLLEYGDTLEYFRVESAICEKNLHLRTIYLHILHNINKIFDDFVPINMTKMVLPRNLKNALSVSLVDLSLNRLYPKTHENLFKYVESFSLESQDLNKYRLVKNVCDGISAMTTLLKDYKILKLNDFLELMKISVPSLSFHKNIDLINLFINICSERLINYFDDNEITSKIEEILLKLLSHHSQTIQEETYKICHDKIINYISPRSDSTRSNMLGSEILFILNSNILKEIASFGITSQNTMIQNSSEDILIYILKCKTLVSDDIWNKIVQCLIESFPILCCHSDRTTSLGRCIINFVDPDTANINLIPAIVVIKCNIQLLFAKDSYVREESFSRLCWFMANQPNSRELLPKFNTLFDKSLANCCKASKLNDVNKMRQTEHFYQPSSFQQVLDVLNSKNVEPVIRRSALNQISVMLEDNLLHQTFYDMNGIEIVLKIMKSCLVESDYENYPDSIIPIASIFKSLCFYSGRIREELGNNIDVFYYILRGLFLFFTEEKMKNDATILLFLLIFKDDLKGSPSRCDFTIPFIIRDNINVPFVCLYHAKNSEHSFPDIKENSLLDKWCLNAIQIQYNAEIFGGFDKLIEWHNVDYEKLNLNIEDILKLDQYTLELIKASSIKYCVENSLLSIQNGISHIVVTEAIDSLELYVNLYKISKNNFPENFLTSHNWEQTFCKFLKLLPSSADDVNLLRKVIKFLTLLVPLHKDCWISDFLKNPRQIILDLLCEDRNKEKLIQDLLLLITECSNSEQSYLDCYRNISGDISWEHIIKTISENLKSNNSQHFYKLAFLDALLTCLVHLTSHIGWSNSKPEAQPKSLIIRLISELTEMVNTFHCGKGSSASLSVMGLSITRNVILILNHLLYEMQHFNIKNWEMYFFDDNVSLKRFLSLWTSRDVILRAGALQMFVGLSNSPRGAVEVINQVKDDNCDIWKLAMTVLFDYNEANIVREFAGKILANLAYQTYPNTNFKATNFKNDKIIDIINLFEEHNFYDNLNQTLSNLYSLKSNNDSKIKYFNETDSENTSTNTNASISTPGLIKSILMFLYNVINVSPDVMAQKLHESGSVKLIFRTLCDSLISVGNTRELSVYCDTMEMNQHVCLVLKKMASINFLCVGTILHTDDCLRTLFSLLNAKIYYIQMPELLYLRNKLWSEIFNLLSTMVEFIFSCEEKSSDSDFVKEINEIFLKTVKNVDEKIFFDAVFESVCSMGSKELQNSVIQFITCLTKIEMNNKFNENNDSFIHILENTKITRSIDVANEIFEANSNGLVISEEICKVLLILYDKCDFQETKNKNIHKIKSLVLPALSGLLCISKKAKTYAFNRNLLKVTLKQLKNLHIKLSLESVDSLRRVQDKKRISPILYEINSLIGLLTNFLIDETPIKITAADSNLADIIHKLWQWFLVQNNYIIDALKLLYVFTTDCPQACQSMPLTSPIAGSGPRKTPGNICLLNAIVALVTKEMDQMNKIRDMTVLKLCFGVCRNCCEMLECRVLLGKSNIFDTISRMHPILTKRQKPWDNVEYLWLEFLKTFTIYPEGQTIVVKNNSVLEFILMATAGNKTQNKLAAMEILRNVSFYQPNKFKLLSSDDFLNVLLVKLQNGSWKEKMISVVMVWTISANCQKAKLIFKSMSLDEKIENVLRQYMIENIDKSVKDGDVKIIRDVLEILRQNDKVR